MEASAITSLDLSIIAGYFLVLIGIAVWVGRQVKTGEDLFLAGRSLGWGVIGVSLFASNISSTTLIGLTGDAYRTGIAVANYEWMAGLVLVFMAFFLVPFYIRTRITTVPEFLEKRFSRGSRLYFSAITIFLSIVVDTAGSLYAGGLVLQLFFPSVYLWQMVAGLAVFAGLYTAVGGLKAVVYTDLMQTVVLLVGAFVLTWVVFDRFDFSWTQATAGLPEGHMSLIRPLDDPQLPWLGTLIGLPILGFYYWATNQYVVQRILGARSLDQARWGTLLGAALKLLPMFVMVIPGALAFTLMPGLDQPDQVFPAMISQLLPPGVKGMMVAALMAAIMSTVDSTLNSSSTLVVVDFIQGRRELTPEQTGRVGRVTTLVFMAIAVAWAPQIQNFSSLFGYLQQAFSYVVPPMVAVFLLGLFWSRGTSQAALATLAGGHLVAALLFGLAQLNVHQIHFTIVAGILLAICASIFVAVSLMTPAPADHLIRETTWARRLKEAPGQLAWYQGYQVQAVLIVALTAAIVLAFW